MPSLKQILQDPPPSHAFEISESGLTCAKLGTAPELQFESFEPGAVTVSPLHNNLLKPEAVAASIASLVPPNGTRKRRAALILPDFASRIAVLDFDQFPSTADEQRSLVRFRMKKSVPFDVDSATVSFMAQPKPEKGPIEVLVVVMASEIVQQYEKPFRDAGFMPGYVTTSSLAMLGMIDPDGLTLIVKLNGSTLTAIVLDGSNVKLVRCLEISAVSEEEVESVVLPTLAYIEDELAVAPKRILLCGLAALSGSIFQKWADDWKVDIQTLRSRYGAPGPANAGVLGYLESIA